MGVLVHPAIFADEWGAKHRLRPIPFVVRWVLFILDAGYDKAPLIDGCQRLFGVTVDIKRRLADTGFRVLPKRWIVERTVAWLNRSRPLSNDYQALPPVSETLI
jgi:putative transposase